jgi:hypothetical protein
VTLIVTAGETATATVAIRPIPQDAEDAPNGVFSYAITLPEAATVATLTLDYGEAINLLDTASGSWEIAPGVYDLLIRLANEDGLSAGVYELVYVYSGLESKAELNLSDITFANVVYLAGTVSATIPAGVSEFTVDAYEDADYSNAIPNATATVTVDGGTWFIKVPASFIGGTVYVKAVASFAPGYTASTGTADRQTVSNIPAKGVTGIGLTVPVIVSAIDKTALNTAIEQANDAKNGVETSPNQGKDLTPGTSWVTQAVLTTFNTAISTAETVKANAVTQAAVDGAVSALNSAKDTFTAAKGTAPTINAVAPAISGQPQSASYARGATASNLTVTASASQPEALAPGVLSYQWYQATDSTASGTSIGSATSASYSPSTATAGTIYYYVVVTNTNTSANGTQTASTTSSRAVVTVTYSGVSVEFGSLPVDETITLTGPENTLSWTANTAITFTVDETFTTYTWDVDGQSVAGSTASLTLYAQDYPVGIHSVTAKVSNGVKTWSKRANFSIGQ